MPGILSKKLVPVFGRKASFGSEISGAVDHFCFHNLEHLFRVNIAAYGTFAYIGVHMVDLFLEVQDGVEWIAGINGTSALVHNPELVEQLENG